MKKVLFVALSLLILNSNNAFALSMKNAKTLVELPYVSNDQVSEISYKVPETCCLQAVGAPSWGDGVPFA